ncbi:hypothetical protein GCM10029992_64530 [Glycomyces albus]
MDDGVGAVLDDAGHAHAHAQHLRPNRGVQDRADAGDDVLDDRGRVVAAGLEGVLGAGLLAEFEVEQFDAHMGLADVDPHDVGVAGVDLEEDLRAPAVGLELAGLSQDALGEQLGGGVADRGGAEPRVRGQVTAGERTVEIQRVQQPNPVAPLEVARRLLPGPFHRSTRPSLLFRDLRVTRRRLTASRSLLNISLTCKSCTPTQAYSRAAPSAPGGGRPRRPDRRGRPIVDLV